MILSGSALRQLLFLGLFALAKKLEHAAANGRMSAITSPLEALKTAAVEAGRSFSGSWLGYHSCVYYADLQPPPPGAHFSQDCGLRDRSYSETLGDWHEYDPANVKAAIYQRAGNPDISSANDCAKAAEESLDAVKSEFMSIILAAISDRPDEYLENLKKEMKNARRITSMEFARNAGPSGTILTADLVALGQGIKVPAHVGIQAVVASIDSSFRACQDASKICKKAASHLERMQKRIQAEDRIGTSVFIGHGQSRTWRELKDFISDRMHLPWDEFNRVPVAGVTNTARLSQMLDSAAIAFLVMTAEDERSDGKIQARMNVIHEAGLFQGRLGFARAIVILEDGCEEFSNIQGLGQIRFRKDNISTAFEEVRRVLERKEMIVVSQ